MDNIVFSLTRVSDAITDKTLYRANVQTNGTLGRDELAEQTADNKGDDDNTPVQANPVTVDTRLK